MAYDGIALISEHQNGAISRRYVHGPGTDDPIVWYEGAAVNDSTRRFLHSDERGSIVSVTDSSGALIGINRYDEYGIPASTNIGRFQYTGQQWLGEITLYHYKARMYAPHLGRFMQTDPIGYADGMNWYAYVGGDPVNFVDPLGLDGEEEDGGTIVVSGKRIPKVTIAVGVLSFVPGDDLGGSSLRNFNLNDYGVPVDDGQDIVVTGRRIHGPPNCPTGRRLTVSGGPNATLFFVLGGISVGADGGFAIPTESLQRGSLRGSQVIGSLNVTFLGGLGLFGGIGPNVSVGNNSGPLRSGTTDTPVIQGGGGYVGGAEFSADLVTDLSRANDFQFGGGGGVRGALGLYAAGGARISRNFSSSQIGCRQ